MPASSTAAMDRVPTYWYSTLRAQTRRACVVPCSPPAPIVSRDSNVTCVVPTCRCRAEGSVPRQCRNTLSNQAGFPQLCHDNANVVASCTTGQFPHPIFQLVEGLVGHLQPSSVAADREAQKLAVLGPVHRDLTLFVRHLGIQEQLHLQSRYANG